MIDLTQHLSADGVVNAVQPRTEAPPDGVYEGVPMVDYRAWDVLNASTLRQVLTEGPTYARWERGFRSSETKSTKLGTAIHGAVLEPDTFNEHFGLSETKGAGVRARMDALKEAGVMLLSQSDLDICAVAKAQVAAHSRAAKLLDGGERELSIVFSFEHDTSTGDRVNLRGKLRLDILRRDLKLACDLKSAVNISKRALAKAFVDYSYDISKAWYSKGLRAAGIEIDTYTFLAVENVLPCRVRLFELGNASTQLGDARMASALRRWSDAVHGDYWPDPPEAVEPLELPDWIFDAWQDREDGGGPA